MNGFWLGRRPIRTNWATRRPIEDTREKLTFEQVFNSTKADNTSVYVGNVSNATEGEISRPVFICFILEKDLREPFSLIGEITEVRLFKAQGYAFVRYEKKECATNAIMEMNGKEICGNSVRCSWGRVQQNVSISIQCYRLNSDTSYSPSDAGPYSTSCTGSSTAAACRAPSVLSALLSPGLQHSRNSPVAGLRSLQ